MVEKECKSSISLQWDFQPTKAVRIWTFSLQMTGLRVSLAQRFLLFSLGFDYSF